jgi:hypothetical protein
MGTGTGEFWVEQIPMGSTLYGPNVLAASAPTNDSYSLQQITGMACDGGGYVPTAIEALPSAQHYDVSELFGRELLMVNKPTCGDHMKWQTCVDQTQYDTTHKFGQSVEFVTATGAINVVDGEDDTDTNGWTCLVLRGINFPTAANSKVLSIEFIIRYEVIPVTSTLASGGCPIATVSSRPSPWTDQALSIARTMINRTNFSTLIDVVKRGAVAYNDYAQGGLNAVVRGQFRSSAASYKGITGF